MTERKISDTLNPELYIANREKGWETHDYYGRTACTLGSRSQTTFYWEPEFDEIFQSLNEGVKAIVLRATKRFELAWKNSNADNDIPGGLDFTPYTADGPWRFIELHLGYDYRAFVMFPDGRSDAYWIHLFKKPGQKVPAKEIRVARSRAIDCWNAINRR